MKNIGETTKEIIKYVAVVGVVVLVVSVPYALVGIARMYEATKGFPPREKRVRRIAQAFARAKKSKLIILREKNDGTCVVELSEKGRRKIKEIDLANLKIPVQKSWDRKWRIVIFDFPNSVGNAVRNAFTLKLKSLGFVLFQKSVWVHAYPCENEIRFLTEFFHVSRFVHIITAQDVSNETRLFRHFDLS